MTECGLKNINVFYSTFTNFFIFVTFFTFFNVFYFFWNVFYIYALNNNTPIHHHLSIVHHIGNVGVISCTEAATRRTVNKTSRTSNTAAVCWCGEALRSTVSSFSWSVVAKGSLTSTQELRIVLVCVRNIHVTHRFSDQCGWPLTSVFVQHLRWLSRVRCV